MINLPPQKQGARWLKMTPGQIITVIVLLLFAAAGLPYLLPLGGPETVHPSRLADHDGEFVEIEGESLYYTHSPGSGPTVILIHGFGGSTVTWRDTLPALSAAGYDVYAVDLLGFGLSEKGWNHAYSHAAQAARITKLMDAWGIDQAVMIGHSMGGNIAAHLALSYPDRVDRLVLVSAAILGSGGGISPTIPAWVLDPPFVRRWGQIALRRILAPRFSDLLLDASYNDTAITPEIAAGYQRALNTPNWDLGLMGITRDSGQNMLPSPVSNIQVPTLILWGAEDTWVSPADGVRLEAIIPNAERIEFPGTGHLVMHENTDAFNAELIAFLDREE